MTAMSGTPAYVQVAEDLRSKITRGELGPGEQLPSNSQLRAKYSVSNTVIRDALNELRRDGLVVGQQGKGVFVQVAGVKTAPQSSGLDELERRVEALEAARDAPGEGVDGEIRNLRQEVATLTTHVIDLYTRMGYPYPRGLAEERRDETGQVENNASRTA